MGTLDANGVWEYDDNDHVVPLSAYMNLGMGSVSDALADLRTDLTPAKINWTNSGIAWDSNWESFASATGSAGYVRYRKDGDWVSLRGLARITVDNSGASPATLTMFTMPVGLRPAHNFVDVAYLAMNHSESLITTSGASAGTAHTHTERSGPSCRVNVNTDGTVQMVRNIGHQLKVGDWVALGGIGYFVN